MRLIRTFSFKLDGSSCSASFPHLTGLPPDVNTRVIERQFHSWLETHAPGAYENGRISRVVFRDSVG